VQAYDPIKLYARLAKYYGWSHKDIDLLHYATFFGYVRETQDLIDEEKDAYKDKTPPSTGTTLTENSLFTQ
jgi:hypothetical protein